MSTRLPFGRYRGRDIRNVPCDYLEWFLENVDSCSPALRRAIRELLDAAEHDADPGWTDDRSAWTPEGGTGTATRADVGTDRLIAIIESWRRRMAMQHHPDRVAAAEVMKAINVAADDLIKALKAETN